MKVLFERSRRIYFGVTLKEFPEVMYAMENKGYLYYDNDSKSDEEQLEYNMWNRISEKLKAIRGNSEVSLTEEEADYLIDVCEEYKNYNTEQGDSSYRTLDKFIYKLQRKLM